LNDFVRFMKNMAFVGASLMFLDVPGLWPYRVETHTTIETILAVMNGTSAEIITAGVGRVQVCAKTSAYPGGFAAEHEGHADPPAASEVLHQDLSEMMDRRYRSGSFDFELRSPHCQITPHRAAVSNPARVPLLDQDAASTVPLDA
jgi:hypothetical protein